jgi:hypothetical protein
LGRVIERTKSSKSAATRARSTSPPFSSAFIAAFLTSGATRSTMSVIGIAIAGAPGGGFFVACS